MKNFDDWGDVVFVIATLMRKHGGSDYDPNEVLTDDEKQQVGQDLTDLGEDIQETIQE